MPLPRLGYDNLGLGVGLRSTHFDYILKNQPEVDWFEVISENFIDSQGPPRATCSSRSPSAIPSCMHGVSLSIGSHRSARLRVPGQAQAAGPGDQRAAGSPITSAGPACSAATRTTCCRCRSPRRRCATWSSASAPSRTSSSARSCWRTRAPTSRSQDSTMDEWEFISRMAEEADCGLLLDVNNVYVSSFNHDFDPSQFIRSPAARAHRAVPPRRPQRTTRTHLIDTHDDHVIDPVWELYRHGAPAHRRRLDPARVGRRHPALPRGPRGGAQGQALHGRASGAGGVPETERRRCSGSRRCPTRSTTSGRRWSERARLPAPGRGAALVPGGGHPSRRGGGRRRVRGGAGADPPQPRRAGGGGAALAQPHGGRAAVDLRQRLLRAPAGVPGRLSSRCSSRPWARRSSTASPSSTSSATPRAATPSTAWGSAFAHSWGRPVRLRSRWARAGRPTSSSTSPPSSGTLAKVFDGPGVEGQPLLTRANPGVVAAGALRRGAAGAGGLPAPARLPLSRERLLHGRGAARGGGEEVPIPEPGEELVALTRRDFCGAALHADAGRSTPCSERCWPAPVGEAIAAAPPPRPGRRSAGRRAPGVVPPLGGGSLFESISCDRCWGGLPGGAAFFSSPFRGRSGGGPPQTRSGPADSAKPPSWPPPVPGGGKSGPIPEGAPRLDPRLRVPGRRRSGRCRAGRCRPRRAGTLERCRSFGRRRHRRSPERTGQGR